MQTKISSKKFTNYNQLQEYLGERCKSTIVPQSTKDKSTSVPQSTKDKSTSVPRRAVEYYAPKYSV